MSRIEAVIFDWGGTLADYAAIELAEMWRMAARHLAPHMPETEVELMARLAGVEAEFWARTSSHQRSGTLADLVVEATAALGVDVADAVLDEAAEHYLETWVPFITHDADAPATLEALRHRGIRIGMLSNTHWPREFHERFLERDGLAHLIDERLYTSEMPYMKPHPETFRAALAAVGIEDASRAVFVGDRPFDDIHGARQAGMRAVLRPNPDVPGYDVTPDASITRLPELIDLVERWSEGEG